MSDDLLNIDDLMAKKADSEADPIQFDPPEALPVKKAPKETLEAKPEADPIQFDPPEALPVKKAPKETLEAKPPRKLLDWPAIEEKVLRLITTTPDSVKTICKKCGIAQNMWFEHMIKDLNLTQKYSIAKEAQTALRIEELAAEAKEIQAKFKTEDSRKVAVRVSLFKITSDNKRWVAERLLPKKYGSHSTVDANVSFPAAIDINFNEQK
jgi:hypothetical protein